MKYKKAIKRTNKKDCSHKKITESYLLPNGRHCDNMYRVAFENRTPQPDEEWKDIDGYDGLYKISNYGQVLNTKTYRIIGTYYKDMQYSDEGLYDNTYDTVSLSKYGKSKKFAIHRLVALAFVVNPNPEEFNTVNHIDENVRNNYYKNLEWCTTYYNLHYGNANNKRMENYKSTMDLKREIQKDEHNG